MRKKLFKKTLADVWKDTVFRRELRILGGLSNFPIGESRLKMNLAVTMKKKNTKTVRELARR